MQISSDINCLINGYQAHLLTHRIDIRAMRAIYTEQLYNKYIYITSLRLYAPYYGHIKD